MHQEKTLETRLAVTVLGSGGPIANPTRASSGYVVWLDNVPPAPGGCRRWHVCPSGRTKGGRTADRHGVPHPYAHRSHGRTGSRRDGCVYAGTHDAPPRRRTGGARYAPRLWTLCGSPFRPKRRLELHAHLRRIRDRRERGAQHPGGRHAHARPGGEGPHDPVRGQSPTA